MFSSGSLPARGENGLQPIRWGRVYFLPSVTISHGWNDNVERLSDEDPIIGPISSAVGDIQPLLRFEMPMRKSLIRLVYRGDFRTYSAEILKNSGGMSHFLDFESHFVASRRLNLDVGARYADTTTSQLNVAPGGEYQYGTQPVTAQDGRMAMGIELGPTQSVELGVLQSKTTFESSLTASRFTDYGFQDLFFRYVLDSGPQNQVYLSVDRQHVTQDESLLQPDDYRIRSLGAGYRRVTGKDLTSEFRVAYTVTEFTEGLWTPFQGLTLEGDFNLAPSPRTQLHFKLRRAPLVSFFNVSAYYINEAANLDVVRALGRTTAIRFTADLQENTFGDPILVTLPVPGGDLDQNGNSLIDAYENLLPSEGEIRSDRIVTLNLTALLHISRSMDFSVGYLHQQSRSNIEASGSDGNYHIYDYESHGLVFSVILGWR
jgi:hypothetical protein